MDIKKKPPVASTPVAREKPVDDTAPSVSRGGSGGGSRGMGRRLDEAGSQTRQHPAAGMERPEKWNKDRQKPGYEEVSLSQGQEALNPEEVSKLKSAGMQEVKIFLADSSSDELLEQYKKRAPGARAIEQDGVGSITVPVKEGTMIITTTKSPNDKTLVCELVVPDRASFDALDWVKQYQAASKAKSESEEM